MGVNVTLVVPSVQPLEVAPIAGRIVGRWGGLSSWEGKRWWLSVEGSTIDEPITVISCDVGVFDEEVYEWWHDVADAVRVAFDQTCVYIRTPDNGAELVYDGYTEKIGGNDANISLDKSS